ncbi:hypothetical protein CMUS01_02352 [Colletotrichum musicola]|uniref:Uncharacterized protein n=1 Tax=Colletotrichum musicola TaxID=2175873 RepID=A0A8H6U776_9PEZI|nr:hypothetical protein CMUS01_02352 [Colletotrichum musicola]
MVRLSILRIWAACLPQHSQVSYTPTASKLATETILDGGVTVKMCGLQTAAGRPDPGRLSSCTSPNAAAMSFFASLEETSFLPLPAEGRLGPCSTAAAREVGKGVKTGGRRRWRCEP